MLGGGWWLLLYMHVTMVRTTSAGAGDGALHTSSAGGCGATAGPTLGRHASRRLGVIGDHIYQHPEVQQQLQAGSPTNAPHLLLVHASGLLATDVSMHSTPTVARLRDEGVQLSSLYLTSSKSAPARSALLTGRHPARWASRGHSDLLPWEPHSIPVGTLLPAALKDSANYATHLVGVWHGGFADLNMTPTARGYDTFLGAYLPYGNGTTGTAPVFGWAPTFLPPPTTLRGSKQQRESCPYWSQMGCFLDAFEKVCGDADEMEQDVDASILDPYGEESLYMCCCPKPYLPCTQQERSLGCDAAFGHHIAPLGPTPKRRLLRDALQRVRGSMRDSDASCIKFTAPAEPLSLCGAEDLPAVARSVGRADIFCEAVTWQWEQLGDGDPVEFAENGCSGYVPHNQEPNGDWFKSSALAFGEAPAFPGDNVLAASAFLPPPTTLRGSKQQRESCPYWSQMGCFLDAFEKVCGDADEMEQDVDASILDPYGEESLYMCCCPKPYLPCTQQERSLGCDAAFGHHIAPLGPTPKRRLLRDALQRVRGSMRDSDASCIEFTAPAEPLSLCGAEDLPAVARSVGRADIFCEAVTWQWEQLGDGDPVEFAENGCSGYIPDNVSPDGDSRKSAALASGAAPTFRGIDLHDDEVSGRHSHVSADGSVLAKLIARVSTIVGAHPADSGPLFLHLAPEAASDGGPSVEMLLEAAVTGLGERHMWQDTFTFFFSDATYTHLPTGAQAAALSPWESDLKSPVSFVHSTELSSLSGTTDGQSYLLTDVTPTLLGLAGGTTLPDLDGKDIWGNLRDPSLPPPHDELLLEFDTLGAPAHVRAATLGTAPGPVAAIRRGRWKLVTGYLGTHTGNVLDTGGEHDHVVSRASPGVPETHGADLGVAQAYRSEQARVAAHGGRISHGATLTSEGVQEMLVLSGRQTLLYDLEGLATSSEEELVDQSATELAVVAELGAALMAYGWEVPIPSSKSLPIPAHQKEISESQSGGPRLEELMQAMPKPQTVRDAEPVYYSWRRY